MNCDTFRKQISPMLYGELSFDDEELVQQHLEGCSGCREELALERALQREMQAAEAEIPPELLTSCRRNLRIAVSSLRDAGVVPWRRRWFQRLWPSVLPSAAVWKTAGAVTLLAVGFAGGRWTPTAADPVASRVRTVQQGSDGGVQIVVEEVRQRVLEGGMDDQRIRGLLVSAAREAADPGVRVDTVDLLKTQSASTEVRRALLAALQYDVNPGVRLKALEALRSSATEGDTRRVLAQVVLADDNPGVRTQAIDLLTQKRERALVGVLQELMAREDNSYVRLKCQRVLNEMNASVETF